MIYASVLMTAMMATTDLGPGTYTRHVISDFRLRSYHIHVPPCYRPGRPMPVVVALHGLGATGRMFMRFTGFNDTADRCGFIVVYPNAKLTAFGAGATRRPAPDDVAFVNRVLDQLNGMVCVDRCRVYATGLSNGGMLCHRLATQLSHRIAAIASVSGPMAPLLCYPRRPVPFLYFHGTSDPELGYNGPRRGFLKFYSAPETAARWAAINGCPPEPVIESLPDICADCTTVTRATWSPGNCGAEVIMYTIHGGGHTWPGRELPIKLLGKSSHDIDATSLIWEFFSRHSLCCCTR